MQTWKEHRSVELQMFAKQLQCSPVINTCDAIYQQTNYVFKFVFHYKVYIG